jgi:hypothetical protein
MQIETNTDKHLKFLEVELAVTVLDEALTLTGANAAVTLAFAPLALPWFLRDHGL